MKTLTQQDTWSEDLQLPPSHGFLKHDILERICLFLPNQQDCYQACFINRAWCYAATTVLWETPVFRTPISFKKFLQIIERKKRLALNVKHLTLCLPDTPSNTLFDSVNRSELDRHLIKDNILSRPPTIHHLAEYCQQLHSLTIYGWNLGQKDFDKLYSYLPWLKNLKVIGTNDTFHQQSERQTQQSIFQLNTYLPRLSQLTLDGLFPISRSFAHAISAKASNLTSLHISLYSMNPAILLTLCENDTALDLRELTLTHGTHMTDSYVDTVLQRFSKLRLFCLEGSQHLTSNVLRIAMDDCQHLQHLEIRQKVMGKPMEEGFEQEDWQLSTDGTDIRTLLIENVWLYDSTLDNIVYYCPILTKLGLSHGGDDLSDIGIEALVRASLTFLRHVHLIDCPMVTSKALTYLPMPSLYTLYLESNGEIEPVDIFNVCSRAVTYANECNLRPNLRQVCVVGYENIATSVVGTHAIERLDYQAKQWADGSSAADTLEATNYQLTLDQQAIDALALSDDFITVPPTTVLTGHQVIELARKLQMPLNQFVQLLDGLEEPTPHHIPTITSQPAPAPETVTEAPKSRVDQLKNSTSQRARPSTPALWAETTNDPDTLPSHKPNENPTSYVSLDSIPTPLSPVQQESNSDGSVSDDISSQSQSQAQSHTSDSDLDQANIDKEDWPDLSNNGEPIYTGGWGGPSDFIPWSMKKSAVLTNTNVPNGSSMDGGGNRVYSNSISNSNSNGDINSNNNNNNNNNSLNSNSNGNSKIGKGGVNWGASTEENHEAFWRTQTMEEPPPKKRGHLTNLDVATDKWGSPAKVMAWQETKPFVDDVLKSQDNTTYWQMSNGNWEPLQSNETTSSPQASNKGTINGSNGRTTFANERRSTRFSSVTTHSASSANRSLVSNSNPYYDEQTDAANMVVNYSNNSISNDENVTKRYSLSSDDSDVDWDDDDGITINIGNTANTQQSRSSPTPNKEQNGSMYNGRPRKDWGAASHEDKKSAQDSPALTADSLDGAQAKSNGREPRQPKFARPKSVAPVSTQPSSTPPTYTISFAQTKESRKTSAINLWREFADHEKGIKEASTSSTTAVPVAESPANSNNNAEMEESATALLVDTSDSTTVVGTTNWKAHEERNVLHDIYNSMADIGLNNNSDHNTDTNEQETILWPDDTNGHSTDQDDGTTIRTDNITDVGIDDALLLLDSTPSPVPEVNNKASNTSNQFLETSLIDSTASTPTPFVELTTSRLGSSSSAYLSMDMLLDDSPTTTTTTTATIANDAPSSPNDIVTPYNTTTSPHDTRSSDFPIDTTAITTTISSHNDVSDNLTDASSITAATAATTATTATATATLPPTTSTDVDEFSSTHKTLAADEVFLRLSLNTPNGTKLLFVSEKPDLKADVHAFCVENDMLDKEELIYEAAHRAYTEKNANLVLGGLKKKKKKKKKQLTSSTP